MNNVNLETAARILNTDVSSLKEFPEEMQQELIAVLEMFSPDTTEEAKMLYDNLHSIWEKGVAYVDMVNISKETGASLETLLSLDIQSQLMISFEYSMALEEGDKNKAVNKVYQNIRQALPIADLPKVAILIGMEYDKLRQYPRKIWEQLCGAYAMEYEENSDNADLINNLNSILKEAEEENETDN